MAAPLSNKLEWSLANPIWAATLNPVIANPLMQGKLLQNVSLINGNTTINHGLGRQMKGWIIADQTAAASIYRSQPLNSNTLTLNSSAACTVSLYVF